MVILQQNDTPPGSQRKACLISTQTSDTELREQGDVFMPRFDSAGLVTAVAVDHVSMTVQKGEIAGFLGPNGSGKTTTIRLMCGLLTPEAGEGTCLGFDIQTQSQQIKEQVGYMTQRFSL